MELLILELMRLLILDILDRELMELLVLVIRELMELLLVGLEVELAATVGLLIVLSLQYAYLGLVASRIRSLRACSNSLIIPS